MFIVVAMILLFLACQHLTEDPFYHLTVMFSDDADFYLNDFVNKRKCIIWSEENHHSFEESYNVVCHPCPYYQ